jgi:RNA polymerase sigma factor (sigma-70 family)
MHEHLDRGDCPRAERSGWLSGPRSPIAGRDGFSAARHGPRCTGPVSREGAQPSGCDAGGSRRQPRGGAPAEGTRGRRCALRSIRVPDLWPRFGPPQEQGADAEDLVQDTFLKVWRTGSSFDPQRGSMDVWVLLTARSLAIDLLRRRTLETRKPRSEPSVSDVSDEPDPHWYAERRDLIRRVGNAMDRLPPRQRSAVALAYLGQRSCRGVRAAGDPSWHGEEPHSSGDRDPPRDPRRGRLATAPDRHAQAGRSDPVSGGPGIARRVRINRPRVRRTRSWLEVLPLDPRDREVVRAKSIDRSGGRRSGTTPVRTPGRDR